ncbi:hypothetical protein ATO7_13818 [Oceanococcus atlanticus]|uniref:Phosphatase n=1 Tax=Oceanococcus atlanticus TaxID=1317117 RepID=A0A1Y1SCK4_9GAMM|nr:protein tyrosine phosphatase family protein [Oceanococcus atlanticus]ORE86379.1 hypothetical protein ATO7_13818 [Oceanococcus atlanticus]
MSARIEDSFNFRRVSPQLTTSGVVGAERLASLAEQGYRAVINLLPDSSEQAVAGEAQLVLQQGLTYHHLAVDFAQPSVADYERFCTLMDELGKARVHVHCAANYRVTAFYACYAKQRGLWSAEQAKAFIHDVWAPQGYPGWQAWFEALNEQVLIA